MPTFYQAQGKRILDVSLATLGLAALALPMLGIGVVIWLSSGPPVFFVQARVGRDGRLFPLIKFRTMVPGAGEHDPVSIEDDPRATAVGHVLRRLKLDELPQLWNVVKGEMSLVGPRPDVPGFADRLVGDARRILELRPGITGPATLRFLDEEALLARVPDPETYNREVIFPEKVRLNLKYAEDISLRRDVAYLLMTLRLKPRERSH